MRFVEFKDSKDSVETLHSAMRDFLPLAMKELGLEQLPTIKIVRNLRNADQPTFGTFAGTRVTLGINGRHPVDILRTLAHELVHFRQMQNNQLKHGSGETGSNEENEANSVAGVIMRNFSKQFPQYMEF